METEVKKVKLISMVDFILYIDGLTTVEFCDKYGVPHPYFTGDVRTSADQFLQVDAIKYRLITAYAKFLNKELTLDMFEGDKKIFNGGSYETKLPYNNYVVVGNGSTTIFQDTDLEKNTSLKLRINDITGLGIEYTDYDKTSANFHFSK
mgnify:CR=1 FL=1